ncbi:MAG: sigma-54 dependent transcriptional regulator [Gammaproteobacteria bacterium]|nr:sigma-54 dependent transcriptional regulator [Gammaproteobacteria bacterium]
MIEDQPQVLFVDDDSKAGELFLRFCIDEEFEPHVFQRAADALDFLRQHGAAVVVTDLSMPGMDGLALMEEIQRIDPDTAMIMMTGFATVDVAIKAMKLGAVDFLKKPYDMDVLIAIIRRCVRTGTLKRENRLLKRQLNHERQHLGMIGKSSALRSVQGIIEKIADIRCHVIIEGESGTGKELVARAIHEQSQDADRPFVVIDCGAMTESLLESELFGHEKGAFTGAAHSKKGLLETASGGTVFLDEICNISDAMQVKLLRVVQEGQVTRVGSLQPISVDLRFLAATNQNMEQMVSEGRFREDLYHRLHVIKISIPPLRQRPEDIPLLTQHFIAEFAQRYSRDVTSFDAKSMQRLYEYPWPGNIRELKNIIERHVALAESEPMTIEFPDLVHTEVSSVMPDISDWPSLGELEYRYIQQVLAHTGGNREQAAELLGINKSTLWRKLR